MIPKIIHYCWFGGNPLPELAQKCIASWKKHCPDYEIIEWNESNIDFSIMPEYTKQAYEAKKWGFVPDYIRLWIVYNYGGFYLDTDVEIIKSLDDLTQYSGVCGFENSNSVALGLGFGAEKGNSMLLEIMKPYLYWPFRNEDTSLNFIPAPKIDTVVFLKNGLLKDNSVQIVNGMKVFSTDYFCPKDFNTGEINITSNTFTIHHYKASWFSDEDKYIHDLYLKYNKKMPAKAAHWLSLIVGFTKYEGVFKMPASMIKFKIKNVKTNKMITEEIEKNFSINNHEQFKV